MLLWPGNTVPAAGSSAGFAASYAVALAFISLIAERTMAAFPEPQLPEAPALRRILLVTTALLLAAGLLELGRVSSLAWLHWVAQALICVPCAIALELALRAAGRLFLPAPPASSATAVAASLLASLITGGPRSTGSLLRTQFGLDFSRSWALSFLRAAVVPALAGTALFCWCLSGVKLIDLDQRGVYERFGAPVAVLGPGLHVLLPWPLGRLRPVEFGAIHSVAIGVDQAETSGVAVAAEAPAPIALNRLWESTHAGQASYLVPSPSTGQQGFQVVSTEISVLYRVGLTDRQALDSVYTVTQPQELVKEAASRLVLRYFNSRTLEAVLGASRETIAESLRAALVADLDSYHAGIDVVSVLIEEIHPPAGAAAAYHAVQAAQINASASIADEQGRARRVAGTAQQEAHQLESAATATAAETLHTAKAESLRFTADKNAYATGGRAFLMERWLGNLERALGSGALTLVDHRLSPAQAPVIDMRTTAPAATGSAPAAQPAPLPTLPGAAGPARSPTSPSPELPGVD
jgi:regulator of protease activity HflC (stomatin/prohibitin superfamily)